MSIEELALQAHEHWKGKITIEPKMAVDSREALSIAYTPGVAEPCRRIHDNPEDVYKYTVKGNMVAVVSDGTAVLGLGNIGPEAAMPVMEGKAVLFKSFAGVDAFPICLDTTDPDEIVETVVRIAPAFGGINLEDIAAPRCFEIERRLKERLDLPVFHDDQHGTAIVVLAGILNALKVVGKKLSGCTVTVNGAGSAGIAISRLLLQAGAKDVILVDKDGILGTVPEALNWAQKEMLEFCNHKGLQGTLADALKGADVFVGVSAPHIVTREMIARMAKNAVVFAMANPVPEIMPEEAKAGGAAVVGTGRSDFPNQVNNVLVFPGIFKGALEVRTQITDEMKLEVAHALAALIPDEELSAENIMPQPFDPRVPDTVAGAVKKVYYARHESIKEV